MWDAIAANNRAAPPSTAASARNAQPGGGSGGHGLVPWLTVSSSHSRARCTVHAEVLRGVMVNAAHPHCVIEGAAVHDGADFWASWVPQLAPTTGAVDAARYVATAPTLPGELLTPLNEMLPPRQGGAGRGVHISLREAL
jgi:hypothetical protein